MPEYVVALDPGATIGYAYHVTDNPLNRDRMLLDQITPDQLWDNLLRIRKLVPKDMIIVYETFVYRRLPKADLTPVEVIGVIKEFARQHRVPLVGQTPAQAKFYWTDDKLKQKGLWKRNQKHAMDALRHLLVYEGKF